MTEQFQNLPTNARTILGFLFVLAMGTAAATYFYLKGDWLVGLGFFVFVVAGIAYAIVYECRADPRLREIMDHLSKEERKQLRELLWPTNESLIFRLLPGLVLISVPLGYFQIFYPDYNSIQVQLIKLSIMVFAYACFFFVLMPIAKLHSKRLKECLFQTDFARNKGYTP